MNTLKIIKKDSSTCNLCGTKTNLGLNVKTEGDNQVDNLYLPLCPRCIVKTILQLDDVRDDILKDMFIEYLEKELKFDRGFFVKDIVSLLLSFGKIREHYDEEPEEEIFDLDDDCED